jgi:flagellar hook-basal body complex protein FliE
MKTLNSAMDQVGQLQSEADGKVAQLLSGNGQDVHSAMIAVEKASLAFAMMVQVRNKIVAAYQQVSGLQF